MNVSEERRIETLVVEERSDMEVTVVSVRYPSEVKSGGENN